MLRRQLTRYRLLGGMMSRSNDIFLLPHHYDGAGAGQVWQENVVRAVDSGVDPVNFVANSPVVELYEDWLANVHEATHLARASQCACYQAGYVERCGAHHYEMRRMIEEPAVEATAAIDIRRARDHLDWSQFPAPNSSGDRRTLAYAYLQVAYSCTDYGRGKDGLARNPAIGDYLTKVERCLTAHEVTTLDAAITSIHSDPSDQNCEMWADELCKLFPEPPPPAHKDTPQTETHEAQQARQQIREAQQARADAQQKRGAKQQSATAQAVSSPGSDVSGSVEIKGIGKLHIHRHKLNPGNRGVPAQVRASVTGSRIKFVRKLPLGRPFARKAKGGTLIVDMSSSMAWDHAELVAALYKLPGLRVVLYSGAGSTLGRQGYSGHCCVVAEGGKISEYTHEPNMSSVNSGSDADTLVLMYWTEPSRANYPTVWLSDGQTGSTQLTRDTQICRLRGILRVRTFKEALAFMQGTGMVNGAVGAAEIAETRMSRATAQQRGVKL